MKKLSAFKPLSKETLKNFQIIDALSPLDSQKSKKGSKYKTEVKPKKVSNKEKKTKKASSSLGSNEKSSLRLNDLIQLGAKSSLEYEMNQRNSLNTMNIPNTNLNTNISNTTNRGINPIDIEPYNSQSNKSQMITQLFTDEAKIRQIKRIDRNWTLNATKFVMLKYRHWQLALRRAVNFVNFLEKLSEELQEKFMMKKSPAQIKDKINNTKAGYISLVETMKSEITGLPSNLPPGSASKKIPSDVFFFMDRFYNAQRSVFVEDVIKEIAKTLEDEDSKNKLLMQ